MKTNRVYTDGKAGAVLSFEDVSGGSDCLVRVGICRKTVSVDVGGDYVIPEYMPEIRKLIRIDVRPSPPTRFASASEARIGGSLEYGTLYVGADGKLYSAEFSAEYDTSVPFDESSEYDPSENITVIADILPESVSGRVMGARKINVKCRLSARVGALGGRRIKNDGVPADDHIQRLCKKQEHFTELVGTNDEIELYFEPEFEGNAGECICSDCEVFVEEASSGEGYVDCKGYVFVRMMIRGEHDGTYTLSRKIPFSEIVEIEGNKTESCCCAYGTCTYVKPEWKNDDGDGASENKKRVRVGICLNATAFKRGELEYIKDAYSTERECSIETEEYALISEAFCKNGNMTFEAVCDDEETALDAEGAVDVAAYASADEVEREDGKCFVKGKCRFCVVHKSNELDGGAEMLSLEKEFPFRYEFPDSLGENGNARIECRAFAIDPRVRTENGTAKFGCELAIVYKMTVEKKISCIKAVRLGEVHPKKKSGFTVCYPDRSDDLWSVAKKYKTTAADITADNGIDAVSELDTAYLPEGKKYIIV